MKIVHGNTDITITLENSKEIKNFKSLLLHADHDFRLFPVKTSSMQQHYNFLKELEEKL